MEDIIATYLNNTEEELYCKLTDDQIDEVVKNIKNEVEQDKELVKEFENTVDYYAKRYIVENLGIKESEVQ